MPADVHLGFPDPTRADTHDIAAFLLAVDRLPGVQRIRRAMRAQGAVTAGNTVVDLGCGPGWETERIARAHPAAHVVGVDHNPALIAAARARVPGGSPVWLCGDLVESGLPPASVDVVRAERVLMYVPQLAWALDRLVAMLRPAGRIVAFELDYGATLLAPGSGSVDVVRRAAECLLRSLPQPWAGRTVPELLHRRGLAVSAEPHSFAVDRTVWRRIVRDTVVQAVEEGQLERAATEDWLAEVDEPGFPGFRAAFTGVLTTAVRR